MRFAVVLERMPSGLEARRARGGAAFRHRRPDDLLSAGAVVYAYPPAGAAERPEMAAAARRGRRRLCDFRVWLVAAGARLSAALLLPASAALSAIVLTRLGRSFSLMSEARGLVTHGPYRFVRHPLYHRLARRAARSPIGRSGRNQSGL